MTAPDSASVLKGIALVCGATLMFAVSDTAGKHLFTLYSVMDVAAVRYLVTMVLLFALLYPVHGARLWRANRILPLVARGLCLVFATITMSLALRLMPVGETVAILYLSPFLVMLLAGPLLGERVTPAMWTGATAGFSGVLLIVRPGGGLNTTGVVLMLINALLATGYHLSTRALAKTETTEALLFYSSLTGMLVFCGWFAATPHDFRPPISDAALMLLLGVLSTAGHFMFTAAYREAPASLLAPVNYLHLVWAGLLGYIVFAHVPDRWASAGMAAIALSGIATAWRVHRARSVAG